jgi:hypothetical protein
MTAFILLNLAAALAAGLLAALSQPRARRTVVVLTALSAWLVVVHSVLLLSGLMSWLTVGGVASVVACVLAGALCALAAAGAREARRRLALAEAAGASSISGCAERDIARVGQPEAPEGDGAHRRGAWLVHWAVATAAAYPVIGAIAAMAVWTWPHVTGATRLWIWDDYTYHMVYPAMWLHDHAIAAVTPAHAFTMQAWYPLSASVVAAWFMLPFHGSRGDALAWVSLTGPIYAGIFACGAAALLQRLGRRPGAWAPAVILFAGSSRIAIMAGSFSDADLAQAVALFAAFVFGVPRGAVEHSRDVTVDACYAGLLTGLALGIKVSAAVPALVVLVMLALRAVALAREPGRTPTSGWAATRTLAIFALSWIATSGYWYARNLLHTGNPVYPGAFLFWPGTRFPETTLREYAQRYGIGKTVSDALEVYMNWPRVHAAIAVAGLVGLASWLVWRRRSLSRCKAYFGCGALGITVAVLATLPVAPFSAGNAMTFRSGFVHWDSMRYVALLPLLGWTAIAFLIDGGAGASPARVMVAAGLASASLLTSPDPLLHAPAFVIATLIAAAVLSAFAARDRGGRSAPRSSSVAAMVVSPFAAAIRGWRVTPIAQPALVMDGRRDIIQRALTALVVAVVIAGALLSEHTTKSRATAAAFYQERFYGGALTVLDLQPPGTRVAVFGDQWIFPIFGDRDQLAPVRLDGDGRVATAPIGGAMYPGDLHVDRETFLANLHASGVRLVVVAYLPHPGRSTEWPAQAAALDSGPGARRLFRAEAVGVWAIEPR